MKIMVVRNIYPYLGLEFVMSAVINKYSNISWYLTVSKSLIEKQRMNYVLFSLETKSSKFWSVKYTKMRKILASIFFFQKVTYYNVICCKNYNFNMICQRIYELIPGYYVHHLIEP